MNGENTHLSRRRFLELGAGTVAAGMALDTVSVVRASDQPAANLYTSFQEGDVPRERTLILVGVGGEAPNRFNDTELMNPYLPGISRSGYQAVFEPLAFYNMLTGEDQFWLAESYEYNGDFTEISIKLRPDVLWNDGTPFTANDVAFTLHMLRDNPTLTWGTQIEQWVKEAVVDDEQNLRVLLNAPNPRFFFGFLTHHADIGIFIVPEHIWAAQDPTTFTNFDMSKGWPVVTGAYKLVRSTAEQKVWDLYPDWWAAKADVHTLPEVERIIFLPGFEESRHAQMIINNEVDATLNLSPATMETTLVQNPKVITHSGKELPYGYTDWWPSGLGFNSMAPPWNDPEIRWAISYAIDREQLVQFGYRGAGESTLVPFPYYPPLMEYIEGIQDLLEQYPTNAYDPSKTEEILTRKGYVRDSEGFWAKEDKRFAMNITTFSVFGDIAPIVTQQLQNVGIDATFGMPTDFSDRVQTGMAESYIWGHGGSVRDPYATLELYHGKFVKPTGEPTYPFYRWVNEDFNQVVDEMAVTAPEDPAMMDLFRAAMEIWLRELPDVQLLQFYHRIPMNTTYWTNWPTEENPYINGSFWHRTVPLVLMNLKAAQE